MRATEDEMKAFRARVINDLMVNFVVVEHPDRKIAEQVYTMNAFDYVSNPVGSNAWMQFWSGWRAAHEYHTAITQPQEAN